MPTNGKRRTRRPSEKARLLEVGVDIFEVGKEAVGKHLDILTPDEQHKLLLIFGQIALCVKTGQLDRVGMAMFQLSQEMIEEFYAKEAGAESDSGEISKVE